MPGKRPERLEWALLPFGELKVNRGMISLGRRPSSSPGCILRAIGMTVAA